VQNIIDEKTLAGMIDHTNLKAFATEKDFEKLCQEAKEYHFAMVAINPYPVAFCKSILKGTGVHVGAAIAFPLGQTDIESKVAETLQAISDGADEIDYVLNVGKLKEGNTEYIRKEMQAITSVCRERGIICKVIFENCYLTKEQIVRLAEIAKEVKPDFIKTSTGFGTGGATPEDVRLMKETVGDAVKVKAAGGIRDWASCKAMIDAGAERIGASAGKQILEEAEA
jgi:deoxyribose-phosphate aldolase